MNQQPVYKPPRKPHPHKYRYMTCLTQLDDMLGAMGFETFWRQSHIKAFLEKRGLYYGN